MSMAAIETPRSANWGCPCDGGRERDRERWRQGQQGAKEHYKQVVQQVNVPMKPWQYDSSGRMNPCHLIALVNESLALETTAS